MQKEKILGMTHTEEIIWYRFTPTDKTLEFLDSVFDIYDNIFENDSSKIYSYSFKMDFGDFNFFKETKEFSAYFIFSKSYAHLLLRKTKNWEKFSKLILEKFEFIQGAKLR